MVTILVDTAELRRRGLRNEAEAVEAVEESGSNGPPPSTPPAIITGDDNYGTAHGCGGATPEGAPTSAASAGSAPAASGADVGQSTADLGGTLAVHSAASTGPASAPQGGNVQESGQETKADAYGKSRQEEHAWPGPHDIDPDSPLSGLRSDKLRESLEREAFRSVDTVAQDSAIAARARTFAERVDSGTYAPPSIDISRAAQDARISALNGEVPAWVRGNPELDPAILKAAEQTSVRAPVHAFGQSPLPSPERAPSQEHALAPARTPGREFAR
ncbi:hypothetical protein [Laribacter hongkongensis]|uniref:hypothetical protein n=1 Tax=Laribacter hongkongensis TaxID=168471 RepID=UPI001EFDFBD5|nr:hypothetical protein [Laribacter hongkongensis]MCG9096945.1 hypothetical protein [Laribacter hongkongensis]